jgi:hypothetical protein
VLEQALLRAGVATFTTSSAYVKTLAALGLADPRGGH